MTPTITRPIQGDLEIRYLPRNASGSESNGAWLRHLRDPSLHATWVADADGKHGHWAVARQHLELVAEAIADLVGEVDIYEEYHRDVECNRSCRNAKRDECVCSCCGENHGTDSGAGIRVGFERVSSSARTDGVVVVHRRLTRDDVATRRGAV